MTIRVEVVCLGADGSEQRRDVLAIERRELAMETLGMNLAEGKALLQRVQDFVVAQPGERRSGATARVSPMRSAAQQQRLWEYGSEDRIRSGRRAESALGKVHLPSRWSEDVPAADNVAQRTHQSGDAISGDEVGLVDPLCESGRSDEGSAAGRDSVNQETVRAHLYATAERIERELGEEQQLNLFEGSEEEWEQQALPDSPITVGIDGGYVRAAHKQGWFEVIAGKSVVAFRREEEGEVASAKCFRFVQTYDEKPRRRLWELMKLQGMQGEISRWCSCPTAARMSDGCKSTFIRSVNI